MEKNYILLDKRIAKEFHEKAMKLPEYPHSYGSMKRLQKKLMELCGVLELEALNILCGRNVADYINKYDGIANGNVIEHKEYTGEIYVTYRIDEDEKYLFD